MKHGYEAVSEEATKNKQKAVKSQWGETIIRGKYLGKIK